MTVIDLQVNIYPLPGLELQGSYAIADHINLSGSSPAVGFVPLGDLYVDKNNADAIKVVCLKEGVEPTTEESAKLQEQGISAYSYELLQPALYAAAQGQQVKAIGVVPSLPQGFSLATATAGIKASGNLDLGVIVSETACQWAGTFTQNLARAVCVEHNIAALSSAVRAVVCNSGNANACTGEQGKANDLALRSLIAKDFGLGDEEVLTASTGVIGRQLDMSKLESANLNKEASVYDFAQSILTTDLVTKISQKNFTGASMLGFAKGSGMIAPNMATMLGFIVTDVKLDGCGSEALRAMLKRAVDKSFNAISVDSDTSTNDMVLLLINQQGASVALEEFEAGLEALCQDLAKKIVLDGEGATKLIELRLNGVRDVSLAKNIGKSIINSPLVKTAIFGNDPNWGRVIAALGKTEGLEKIKLEDVSLEIQSVTVFDKGLPLELSGQERNALSEQMQKSKTIILDLNLGEVSEQYKFWGCDLSYGYVEINAEYTT